MRRAVVVIVVASLVGLTTATAFAAAPRLILVDGGGLSRPIVLADWSENGTLLSAWKLAQPARNPQLRCRPAYRLSFLWGPEWNDYVASRKPLHAIRPSDTAFHGRFWPAWRGRTALFTPGPGVVLGVKVATAKQLRILRRHGLPGRAPLKVATGCRSHSSYPKTVSG
jgi:hypothetical protein